VQLAAISKKVVGVEVRPRNIVASLVRLFVHDVPNASLLMKDVREVDGRLGRFDVLFHVGVLYHLTEPAEHLHRIAELGPDLVLDTHYCNDDTPFPRSDVRHAGRTYKAFVYREGGWGEAFSGVEPTARWLHLDALLQAVRDAGFRSVEVIDDRAERNGPRMTLLARKAA
jgi:hypothetical protein